MISWIRFRRALPGLLAAATLSIPALSVHADEPASQPAKNRPGRGEIRRHMDEMKAKGILGHGAEAPKAGETAPDFTLTPIKFYDFDTDETEITRENADVLYQDVTLSRFRGEKPVVLIFGSYT